MKKILFSLGLLAVAAGVISAKSDKDPVIMTVNGRPVNKSEFEYLYNKNAGQQIEHQTLDEYVDMFVNYKLKVADALANHYDTTSSFQTELSQYRAELAAPYMLDKEAEKELMDEAYNHYKRLVNVSHIMLQAAAPEDPKAVALADSIRTEILAGRLDWADAAARFSIDRGTSQRGGNMGWLVSGRYPAAFEDAAYSTAVGEISQPVFSGYGYHIVKVNAEKPNPGEVKARHILKLTARKSPEEAAKAKQQIDSIYEVLMTGADFGDVARRESEDPGSKANGGELDWFGAGMMVAPFDSAAFTLPEGEISRPVETAYGWHIIEVTGHRPMKSREEMDDQLRNILNSSEKGNIPARKYLETMKVKYNSHLLEDNLDKLQQTIAESANGYDSTMIATLKQSDMPVAVVAGEEIALREVMPMVAITASKDARNARNLISQSATRLMENRTRQKAQVDLADTNAEYRNLINEYTDGILLFNISQDKVWQKAANDRHGLEKYFEGHRQEYTFDEPRFKAYIVFTTSDSLENEVKNYLAGVDTKTIDPTTFPTSLRDKFGKHVRVERVIAKKGENPITDYLAFGGSKPDNKALTWTNYFAFNGQIIDQPVEVDDVRSRVISDYQNALEKEWIDELHAKYPVKIDKKVLKQVKEAKVD
ncbi:MAG: peptidylprolyl isomerase [Muribaculaceae bacterium]|nr:peptidylprolyl isomerase [Muribaculaceae bacterium]